jgi:hypothetical protein
MKRVVGMTLWVSMPGLPARPVVSARVRRTVCVRGHSTGDGRSYCIFSLLRAVQFLSVIVYL